MSGTKSATLSQSRRNGIWAIANKQVNLTDEVKRSKLNLRCWDRSPEGVKECRLVTKCLEMLSKHSFEFALADTVSTSNVSNDLAFKAKPRSRDQGQEEISQSTKTESGSL